MSKEKTGEVFYRDEDGKLHYAASYCDGNGNVTTEDEVVEYNGEDQ